MKISPTLNTISYRKNSLQNHPAESSIKIAKSNVSFGSLGEAVKNQAVGLFKFIEKHGFFVEFLIVDTCSLVIPRILVGLNRDRDKTGKINYQAGAEEAGREVLSGPSMNLIPMGFIGLLSKVLSASHMSRSAITSFTDNMKQITETNPGIKKKEELHQKLADGLFDDAFGEFELQNKGDIKTEFSKLLTKATNSQSKSEFKNQKIAFVEYIKSINNKNTKSIPLNTKTIKLKAGNTNAAELFEDFRDYSKDIIEKLIKTTDSPSKFLEKIEKNRLNIKFASAITVFFAVGSFLLYLPKVYQRGKVSPAMKSAQRAEGGANNENK